MRKRNKLLAMMLAFFMTSVITAATASADGVGYSVDPKMPPNQREGVKGHFDLLVEPGQKQDLTLTIKNQNSEAIVVTVEAITASTSRGGEVNYSKPGTYDETMRYAFTDIASLSDERLTIPAKSSRDVTLSLSVPEEKFEGIILGSIRVLKEISEEEKAAGGMIVNQYAYVVAVKLSEGDYRPDPDFLLKDIKAGLTNYRASVVASIRNPKPILIKGASGEARIYQRGGSDPVMELIKDKIDFAPNSIFQFSLIDDEGYGIKAGEYTAKIRLEHEGRIWDFEEDFEITPQEAASVNQGALNQTRQRQLTDTVIFGLPLWAVITIGAASLLFIGAVIMIIVIVRKRNGDDDDDDNDEEDSE